MAEHDRIVDGLLDRCGTTYTAEAGIRLADTPGPLYQLHVLATLLSARISAGVAVAAARELFGAGYRSPAAMARASWQDRVDALGRGRYRRYDERTATMLGDAAAQLSERWHGDLRRLREAADGEPHRIADLLTGFPGIGPAGASIFLREVQETWSSVGPYVDSRGDGGRAQRRLALRPRIPDRPAGRGPAPGQPCGGAGPRVTEPPPRRRGDGRGRQLMPGLV